MKGSSAAPLDSAATPAWEQELEGLDYHPEFLDGETVIRKVGRWVNHVKKRLFGNW
jgi:hypothetical protein